MERRLEAIVPLILLCAMGAWPGGASAQAGDAERTALARSLFTEGVELASEERYAEAAERFRRVRELQPTPGVAYNLAAALERSGELVEASELLREVTSSGEASPALAGQATELLADVEERIAHLTVRTEGPAEGSSLRMDDAPLAAAALGVSMPVDPGAHVIEALRDGEQVARQEVELAEGESAELTVTLPPLELAVEAEPAPPPPPAEPPSDDGGGILSSPLFWIGAAVVVAAAAVGGLYLAGAFDGPDPIEGNATPGVLEWD